MYVVVLSFTSCSDDDEPTEVSYSSSYFNEAETVVSASSSSLTLRFTTNKNWEIDAESSSNWIQFDSQSGEAGVNSVIITCAENTTYSEREATITLIVDDTVNSFVIRQMAKGKIQLSATETTVEWTGDTIEIDVEYNVDYTCKVESGASWLTELKDASTEDKRVFVVSEYDGYQSREATISFSSSSSKQPAEQSFTVSQDGHAVCSVSTDSISVAAESGMNAFSVESNFTPVITVSESWLSVTEDATVGYLVSFDENTSYEQREAMVFIADAKKTYTDTITLVQDAFIFSVQSEILEVRITKSKAIEYAVNPSMGTITWSSSNTSIATVDSEGTVTAVAKGTTSIKAQIGEKIEYVTVSVYQIADKFSYNSSMTVTSYNSGTGYYSGSYYPSLINKSDETVTIEAMYIYDSSTGKVIGSNTTMNVTLAPSEECAYGMSSITNAYKPTTVWHYSVDGEEGNATYYWPFE